MGLFRSNRGRQRVGRPDRTSLEDQGWVLPVGFGRTDGVRTRVGTVDSDFRVELDQRGVLSLPLADPRQPEWCIDWWIGADDRWHLASLEPGARQALVGGSPVVETRLRIPGGDAIQRVFGVRGPDFATGDGPDGYGDEYLVLEVENDTPVPFALALVVRPFAADGAESSMASIRVGPTGGGVGADTAQVLRIDGRPVALLPRRPARATGATGWADVAATVTSGEAPAELGSVVDDEGPAPTAALLFPVTHRTTFRVLLPLGAAADGAIVPPYPSGLPGAEQVANGWAVQTRRLPRVEVPEGRLAEGIDACRRSLLLTAGDTLVGATDGELAASAELVLALDRDGLHAEAARLLAHWPDRFVRTPRPDPSTAASALAAIVDHWRLTRDQVLAEALLPEVVALAASARRTGHDDGEAADVAARWAFADYLAGLGQVDAAAQAHAEAQELERVRRARPADPDHDARWARMRGSANSASPTWSWAAGEPGAARFLNSVRDLLVAETADGLALLPAGFGPWWGQGVELHDAPTASGRLSFAVRWHGDRPAVLWELAPHSGVAPVLTAPVVDPQWRAVENRGDALLAAVPRPEDLEIDRPTVIPAGQGHAESMAPRSVLPTAGQETGRLAGPSPVESEAVAPAEEPASGEPPPDGGSFS